MASKPLVSKVRFSISNIPEPSEPRRPANATRTFWVLKSGDQAIWGLSSFGHGTGRSGKRCNLSLNDFRLDPLSFRAVFLWSGNRSTNIPSNSLSRQRICYKKLRTLRERLSSL